MPEKTAEQIREEFLSHIAALVRAWASTTPRCDVPEPRSVSSRLDGLVFSILSMIDGETMQLPAFRLVPDPHPDDRTFHETHGEDWYPENNCAAMRGEITQGVELHELWAARYSIDERHWSQNAEVSREETTEGSSELPEIEIDGIHWRPRLVARPGHARGKVEFQPLLVSHLRELARAVGFILVGTTAEDAAASPVRMREERDHYREKMLEVRAEADEQRRRVAELTGKQIRPDTSKKKLLVRNKHALGAWGVWGVVPGDWLLTDAAGNLTVGSETVFEEFELSLYDRVLSEEENAMENAMNEQQIESVARAAHEANRAYCIAMGDISQPRWEDAPLWQRTSSIKGVAGAIAGNTPEQSHQSWLAEKRATGWKYGPVKDPEKKEHPCIMPYSELAPEQRAKDHIFLGTVRAMVQGFSVASGTMRDDDLGTSKPQ